MNPGEVLRDIVDALDGAGIPHMLVGSLASNVHGAPRSTQDIDLVVAPTEPALMSFLDSLDPERFYVPGSAVEALRNRDQFNVIDTGSGWKIDLIIRKERPFSRSEFDRRRQIRAFGVGLYVASPEDTVLAKLEWAARGASDRQLADAATVISVLSGSLDDEYLDRWAADLGVSDLLSRARRSAQDQS